MPVVNIADVGRYDGQEVTLRGWLYNLRESGKLRVPAISRRHRHSARRRFAKGKSRSLCRAARI